MPGSFAVPTALAILITAALNLPLSTALTLDTESALLGARTGKTREKLSPQEQYVSGGNCLLRLLKVHGGGVVNDSPVRMVVDVTGLGWRNDRSAGMSPCPG